MQLQARMDFCGTVCLNLVGNHSADALEPYLSTTMFGCLEFLDLNIFI